MPVKKVTSKKTDKKSSVVSRQSLTKKVIKTNSLSVPIYSLMGKSTGQLSLPKELFAGKVNKQLLAQALRVYLTNSQAHWGYTKTRAEVKATTAKWFRQKGTGRARHGAKSAPIFVGGGVAFGPKPRKTKLSLPKKMGKQALVTALTVKMKEQQILGVDLTRATGKTQQIVGLLKKLEIKSVLVSDSQKSDLISRSVRNLQGVNFLPADLLNPYEVIKHQTLVLTKAAVERLEKRLFTSKQNTLISLKKKGEEQVRVGSDDLAVKTARSVKAESKSV